MNTLTSGYCVITAKLTFQSALHVGTGRGNPGSDAPLRRNVRGDLVIPGTAIAGTLRTLATRLAQRLAFGDKEACLALKSLPPLQASDSPERCGCAVCHLFGEVHPGEGGAEEQGGRASRLWVYDAPLIAAASPFVRDGVGIDRATAAAARAGRVKYDTEIIPAGATFDVTLELEDASVEDEQLLAATLAEWCAGRAWLGAGGARGLGRAALSELRYRSNPLTNADQLIAFLRLDDRAQDLEIRANWLQLHLDAARQRMRSDQISARPFIEVTFLLSCDGPFLCHDATAATVLGFDHVSQMDGVPAAGEGVKPILPGSSLRGVLRAHAERIARTLATHNANGDGDVFLRNCPACDPTADKDQPLAKCDKLLELPTDQEVNPNDPPLCLACQLFGSARLGSRLRVADAPILGEAVWKVVDFLAIDRFTGGSLTGAKFDALALWQPQFTVHLFLEEPEDWELGWLALVLRDLIDGQVTFGFGAAKGLGHMNAIDVSGTCGFLTGAEWGQALQDNEDDAAAGFFHTAHFDRTAWADLEPVVRDWIGAFLIQVAEFKRSKVTLPELPADTYFRPDLPLKRLYPVMEEHDAERG